VVINKFHIAIFRVEFSILGGSLYGSNADNNLYHLDLSTGTASLIGATGAAGLLQSFAIIDGIGYSQDVIGNTLYRIDLGTGQSLAAGAYGHLGGGVTGLTHSGDHLYEARIAWRDLVEIDIHDGSIVSVTGMHNLGNDTSIAYTDGTFWTIPALDDSLYRLDPNTGAASLVHTGLSLPHVTALTGIQQSIRVS